MFLDRNFGIGAQAKAVHAILEARDGLEPSWNEDCRRYMAYVQVAPWYNGRERGIVVYLREGLEQLNIAVYEARSSDEICVLHWERYTGMNPPTLNDFPYDCFEGFEDRWNYGQITEVAESVVEYLEAFWNKLENEDEDD